MAIGVQYTLRLHDVAGVLTLDSLVRKEFTHPASFVAPVTTVKFEDYTGTTDDAYEVKTSYPTGGEPASSTTVHDLIAAALVAIDAAIAAGQTGGGSGFISPTY